MWNTDNIFYKTLLSDLQIHELCAIFKSLTLVENVFVCSGMSKFSSIRDVEHFIRKNSRVEFPPTANFDLLLEAIQEIGEDFVLKNVLPYIQKLTREFQCQDVIKKLLSSEKEVQLTRIEIASLLAHAFFCSVPANSYYGTSDINFHGLYNKSYKNSAIKKEKIKCLIIYFQVFKCEFADKREKVSYRKNAIRTIPFWRDNIKPLADFVIIKNNSIGEGFGMSQVNFANKCIGGGVLGNGALQEEIRFITCPELIVSRLFCPQMQDNEAIIIENVVQYSNYEGYGDTFRCKSALLDTALHGPHTIVSIDALDYSASSRFDPKDQYSQKHVDRELTKAFAGFSASKHAIVTGNWGGGYFGGDPLLKAKIQLIAASEAGQNLYYYTFVHQDLYEQMTQFEKSCKGKTVGELYREIFQRNYATAVGNSTPSNARYKSNWISRLDNMYPF